MAEAKKKRRGRQSKPKKPVEYLPLDENGFLVKSTGRGHRIEITGKGLRHAEECFAQGMSEQQVAALLKIDRNTWQLIKQRQPNVQAVVDQGKARGIERASKCLGGLMDSPDHSVRFRAACFYLKCHAGWRENIRLEHTGADGGAIKTESETKTTVKHVISLKDADPETLDKLLAEARDVKNRLAGELN